MMSSVITLSNNSAAIQHLKAADIQLKKVIALIGEISYVPYSNSLRFVVETIVGQMLSNKVADIMSSRLLEKCGGKIDAEVLATLSLADLQSIGISKNKAQYIEDLVNAVQNEPKFFDELQKMTDQEVISRLTSFRGIGSWTAKMYLIFVLNRQNVLPYEDGAFLQSYVWLYKAYERDRRSIERTCHSWVPYTSIGARYLYRLLDSGFLKYANIDEAIQSQHQKENK